MNTTILETEYFTVSQCRDCDVPGYLIVMYKENLRELSELPHEAKCQLGVLLSEVESSITKVLAPEKVYCCKFGEAASIIHFHLFPRTVLLSKSFLSIYPEQLGLIHGPLLFDWARDYYKVKVGCFSPDTIVTFNKIKAILSSVGITEASR
ncbi:hypothetical protein AB733_20300 [Photobacterium swingsii]|uniref:HIT domain-containing protein n=1 Tax=Photobacterium swingsii TaxID=680026 RepID=A0A0J8V6C9_9GAMM|nr:HIT domain-containing protein [Photobacterium swingsii]KMV29003.1 hypothetical protein AB733_20300 [Photobacterium swingsii]PSW22751.1 hypothetical protein C9I94_18375 [Photobacterium swingsii]